MRYLTTIAVIPGLITGLAASSVSTASNFSLQHFDIDGAHIGDSQNRFLRDVSPDFPANISDTKRTYASSLIYTMPIHCETEKSGMSRCKGTFAEMKKRVAGKHKEFVSYRNIVADFNQNNELVFLSTIKTTQHHDKKACLKALSKFYQQSATKKAVKPLVIYPRNQLNIYYIKIDEPPFATRIMGKLDSAFSMVWQKQRGDWSAFYSIDFGCRDSGYMVVNETLYDEAKKTGPDSLLKVSNLGTK